MAICFDTAAYGLDQNFNEKIYMKKMPPTGLEPATLGLKVRCSSRLSYEGFLIIQIQPNE